MGCSVNRFFQYNIYLQQINENVSLLCVICIVPVKYLFTEMLRLQIMWSLTVESLRWVWHQQWPVCDPTPCAWEVGLFRKREKSRNRAHRSLDGHRWRRQNKRYHTAARGNKAALVYNPAHLAMTENTFIKIWHTNIFVFFKWLKPLNSFWVIKLFNLYWETHDVITQTSSWFTQNEIVTHVNSRLSSKNLIHLCF